jgi:hypothetical protein
VCIKHGAIQKRKVCSSEGCINQVYRKGKCVRHESTQIKGSNAPISAKKTKANDACDASTVFEYGSIFSKSTVVLLPGQGQREEEVEVEIPFEVTIRAEV